LFNLLLLRLAEGVVQFLCEQWFRRLGFLDGGPHFLQQLIQFLRLLLQFLTNLLAVVVPTQAGVLIGLVELFQFLGQRFLFLVQFLSVGSQLTNGLVEFPSGLLSKLVAQFFELSFCASARGQGFGGVVAFESFAGLTDILTSLLQLVARLLHRLLVLGLLHPFVQLVGLTQQILLLFAKAFQLSLDFFLLLFGLGLFERGLQLREFFVQILLASCEIAETVQHLTDFPLLLILLRRFLRLALGLVTVFLLIQFQFIKLTLATAL
jgi:hypothetical protein